MKKDKKKRKLKKNLVNKLVCEKKNNKRIKRKRTSRNLRGRRKPETQEKTGPIITFGHGQKHQMKQNNEDNKEYFDKIKHKYKDNINFKSTLNITKVINKNNYIKLVDLFEVYTSYKDNIDYLALPNKNNLDIIELNNNKKVMQLKGHKLDIFFVKYYLNNKNNNEYLLTIEGGNTIFVWDINDKYKIIIKNRNTCDHTLFSCLLVFPPNYNDNFLVVPPIDCDDEIGIKIISLENGKMIRNIITYYYPYLLSWYNEKDRQNYIIQLNGRKIIINNLIKDEKYFESEDKVDYSIGFIYNCNNIDYLYTCNQNGFIQIVDLNNKKIIKEINTNSYFFNIIQWNNRYIIGCEYKYIDLQKSEYSIKIVDIKNGQVLSKIKYNVKCVKKFYNSKYGEFLLISDDNYISLWKP